MKIPSLVAAVGFLTFALRGAASASPGAPPASGPEGAVRLGLALPAGQVQSGSDLSSSVSSTVPLIFEGGYRFDPTVFVGGYFQYAFADVKNGNGATCPANASCGGSDVGLGLEAIYRLMPETKFAPWLGLGGGYEWLSQDASSTNFNAGGTTTLNSWQAVLQVGGDVRVSPQLVLGPFVQAQLGRYYEGRATGAIGNFAASNDITINDTAWHAWIGLGVRGAIGF